MEIFRRDAIASQPSSTWVPREASAVIRRVFGECTQCCAIAAKSRRSQASVSAFSTAMIAASSASLSSIPARSPMASLARVPRRGPAA